MGKISANDKISINTKKEKQLKSEIEDFFT